MLGCLFVVARHRAAVCVADKIGGKEITGAKYEMAVSGSDSLDLGQADFRVSKRPGIEQLDMMRRSVSARQCRIGKDNRAERQFNVGTEFHRAFRPTRGDVAHNLRRGD